MSKRADVVVALKGQRLGHARGEVVSQQFVARAPSRLTVVGLDNLVHLTVVLRAFLSLTYNKVGAVGTHRPVAFGQGVNEYGLGAGGQ